MARSKLTADIPNLGRIEVEGNVATEESIRDLIAAMSNQQRSTRADITDLNDAADDAADNLDEFSDEIQRAERSQKKLTDRVIKFGDAAVDGVRGMQRFVDSGGTFTSMVESVGEIAVRASQGIGGLIPIIGEGLGELAGAAAQAVVGLTTLAVGMVESFIGLNKNIFNAGLQVEGGFDQFTEYAEQANLPINEFANALIQSSDRLRLFSSGAPGGIGRVSAALEEFRDQGIMETLYSLGFTTEEVVAGLADYAIEAERAGRNLSNEDLAAEAGQYLKNLRELSRITGISIKETQAQIEADRANLFVQRELLRVAPENRAEAAAFAAMLEQTAYGPMKDFIVSGQSMSVSSGLMSSQMNITANILRDAYQQVASGSMDAAQGQEYLRDRLRARGVEVDAELERIITTFGQTPELAAQFGDFGKAVRTTNEFLGAASANIAGAEVNPESLQATLGQMEVTLNNVQQEIQSAFIDALKTANPFINGLAEAADNGAEGLGDFRRMLQAVMNGNFAEFNEMLGTAAQGDPLAGAIANLQTAVAAAIEEGFNRVLEGSILGSVLGDDSVRSLRQQLDEKKELLSQAEERRDNATSERAKNFQERVINRINNDIKELEDEIARRTSGIPQQSDGGIVTGPSSGFLTELHGTEAVVPLPDGNTIPVTVSMPESYQKPENTFKSVDILPSMISKIKNSIFSEPFPISLENLDNSVIPITFSLPTTFNDQFAQVYRDFSSFMQDNLVIPENEETKTITVEDFSSGIDNSRTFNDLLQVNRNMLNAMITSMQKTDQLVRAMENSNIIARNTAYLRA